MAGMERIHFDFDQFTLSADSRRILGDNAKYLSANSAVQVVIEGHCDDRGSDEYNLALGESRALAAKNYLVSLGVSAKRLSVISYGEEKPLVNAANEEAWAQNRRAEFKSVK
jgi:peptidoglycan-associated lipoprotein